LNHEGHEGPRRKIEALSGSYLNLRSRGIFNFPLRRSAMVEQERLPRVFVDFNNSDQLGRVRLYCIGTVHDLSRLGIALREGTELLLSCLELEAEGVATYSKEEGGWVAKVDWDKVRDRPDNR
jgi:hypothetical protein